MSNYEEIFACPACEGDLKIASSGITCLKCDSRYKVKDDIPLLYWPREQKSSKEDITDMMREFYNDNPFPNYEESENISDLVEKSRKWNFARLLNEQLPFNIRVLEIGCGTGQLSNFLGIAHRVVFGTDISFNGLKLAYEFKQRNGLERVGFYQMNLFKPIFKKESFSFVICAGVLHHTADPLAGFQSLAKLVKKGGYIIIGLYNRYGRTINTIRRFIFNVSGGRFKFLDSRLRSQDVGQVKKLAWFQDQYKNPHESRHTIGEALGWFEHAGFDFVNSIPKLEAFKDVAEQEPLFAVNPIGTKLDHFLVQASLLLNGSSEGGFFLLIGRKKE